MNFLMVGLTTTTHLNSRSKSFDLTNKFDVYHVCCAHKIDKARVIQSIQVTVDGKRAIEEE